MDKKLLDSLNNISVAIENLVNSLNEKNKSDNDFIETMKSSNISDGLVKIQESLINIKSDTEKILKNQSSSSKNVADSKKDDTEKILKNQSSSSKNVADSKKDDKGKFLSDIMSGDSIKDIKSGVGTIMMIAGGVLAIGAAFSIIGKVDFGTVLSLSIALPLIAIAFEKIAQLKDLTPSSMVNILIITLGMAASIFIMSNILKNVQPISPSILFSVLMISASLSLIGYGVSGLVNAVNKIKNPLDVAFMLPILMLGVSTAIMVSSHILSNVTNITPSQFLTSIAIAVVFIPIAYSLKFVSNAIKDVDYGKILLLPIVMTLMSGAVMLSSYILSQTKPIDPGLLWNIVLQSMTLSLISIALSFSLFVMDKMGINPIKAIMGGLSLIIISGAIMVSSYLLSMGDYSNCPSLGWSMTFSISMLLLSIPVAILGYISLPVVKMGAIGLVLVAAAITAASYILSYIDPKFLYTIADAFGYFMNVVSDSLSYGLKVIAPALKIFISTVGKEIISFAKNILPVIVKAVGELFENVLKPLGEFIKTILPPLGTFLSTIITSVIPLIQIIIDHFSNMFDKIANIFVIVKDIIKQVGDSISGVITSIANGISKVIDTIGSKIEGVLDKISKIIDSASGFINSIGNNIEKTINSIVGGIERLSKVGTLDLVGSATKVVTFLGSIATGVFSFLQVPLDLNKMNMYTTFFNSISKLSDVMNKISSTGSNDPFSKLANGVDRLSSSLSKLDASIDIEKLSALKSLTSSVVVMSMIDSEQFGLFMDKLNEKSSIFSKVMNDVLDSDSGGSSSTLNVKQNSPKTVDDTNSRIIEVLRSMDSKLSTISSDMSSVSLYLNNMDNDVQIKK